jgi:hypothetical protein
MMHGTFFRRDRAIPAILAALSASGAATGASAKALNDQRLTSATSPAKVASMTSARDGCTLTVTDPVVAQTPFTQAQAIASIRCTKAHSKVHYNGYLQDWVPNVWAGMHEWQTISVPAHTTIRRIMYVPCLPTPTQSRPFRDWASIAFGDKTHTYRLQTKVATVSLACA